MASEVQNIYLTPLLTLTEKMKATNELMISTETNSDHGLSDKEFGCGPFDLFIYFYLKTIFH